MISQREFRALSIVGFCLGVGVVLYWVSVLVDLDLLRSPVGVILGIGLVLGIVVTIGVFVQEGDSLLLALLWLMIVALVALGITFVPVWIYLRLVVLPRFGDTAYRVYSQFEEDGMLVFLFAVLGTRSKTFVDIGSGDGINSNCANLAINFGWHGMFIDGSPQMIERGKQYYDAHPDTFLYPPRFVCNMVKRSNINELIQGAGFFGEVDLLSIDGIVNLSVDLDKCSCSRDEAGENPAVSPVPTRQLRAGSPRAKPRIATGVQYGTPVPLDDEDGDRDGLE